MDLKPTTKSATNSLWLCSINSIFLIVALQYATHIFHAGIDAHTAQIAGDYLYGLSWGIPPVIFIFRFATCLKAWAIHGRQ